MDKYLKFDKYAAFLQLKLDDKKKLTQMEKIFILFYINPKQEIDSSVLNNVCYRYGARIHDLHKMFGFNFIKYVDKNSYKLEIEN